VRTEHAFEPPALNVLQFEGSMFLLDKSGIAVGQTSTTFACREVAVQNESKADAATTHRNVIVVAPHEIVVGSCPCVFICFAVSIEVEDEALA
jgi:hypothetical protein